MEMMYRHGAISQAAIGQALGGLNYTTVSLERKWLRDKVREKKALARAVSEIEETLIHR
jgi:uncharacterized protein (UPF0264 family)